MELLETQLASLTTLMQDYANSNSDPTGSSAAENAAQVAAPTGADIQAWSADPSDPAVVSDRVAAQLSEAHARVYTLEVRTSQLVLDFESAIEAYALDESSQPAPATMVALWGAVVKLETLQRDLARQVDSLANIERSASVDPEEAANLAESTRALLTANSLELTHLAAEIERLSSNGGTISGSLFPTFEELQTLSKRLSSAAAWFAEWNANMPAGTATR